MSACVSFRCRKCCMIRRERSRCENCFEEWKADMAKRCEQPGTATDDGTFNFYDDYTFTYPAGYSNPGRCFENLTWRQRIKWKGQ